MTYFISGIIIRCICIIFAPIYFISFCILQQIIFRKIQKRTKNFSIINLHSDQTFQTRSTRKVYQKRFDIIIQMMRCHQNIQPILFLHLLKPIVTQISASHFYRIISCFLISCNVKSNRMKRNSIFSTIFSHKQLITFCIFSTQLKIAMRNLEIC